MPDPPEPNTPPPTRIAPQPGEGKPLPVPLRPQALPGQDDALPPRSPSIVTRLTFFHGIALFLLCGLIAFVLHQATLAALEADLRFAMDAEVRQIAAVIVQSKDQDARLAVQRHCATMAESRSRPRLAVRVREGDTVVARVDATDAIYPLDAPAPRFEAPLAVSGTAAFTSERPIALRRHWEFAYGEVRDARGRLFRVEVMGHRSEIDRILSRFRGQLIFLVSPLMIAAIVAARIYVRRTVAPLRHVTAAATRIGSKTLGERLDVRRAPVEITRLVTSFNEMLDRLEESFRRLTEFGGDLAHELRTPLQNVRGQAEVALLHKRTVDEYREILGGIVEECDRLAKIIDDVLLLSRVERHEEALELSRFDLSQEIEAIREYFETAASTMGVTLAGDGAAAPIEIEGDRLKLRRAIANLVDNAIKYTDAGGRVEVHARSLPGGGAEVVVSDTGRGIAAEHLPRLFERFYRVDKSRSRNTGGAGLGLGIARTIVRAHGGDVRIESEAGKGTRATVTLPAQGAQKG